MSIGLVTGANNMHVLETWQGVIAHNLANASAPGFRASTFEVLGTRIQDNQDSDDNNKVDVIVPVGLAVRNFLPGTIQQSDNPYSLAIEGEGYFALQGPDGETLYTRDGEFHRDSEGMLVNKMGFAVMGNGGVVEIGAEEGPITIAKDGTVSQNGQQVAQISVYEFENPSLLQRGNGSLFIDYGNEAGAQPIENASISQYHLEMSNVVPMKEMVSMISVSRAYEITQKMIQEDDERADKVIQTFNV